MVTDESQVDYTSPLYTQGATESSEYNGMPTEGTEGMTTPADGNGEMLQGTESGGSLDTTNTPKGEGTVLPSSGGKK